MTVEVVPYEERFLGQVADLQRRMWSPEPEFNERYFRWKHARNPCIPGPHALLALDSGRVVAMRAFTGSRWEGGTLAAPLPLPLACDAVVAGEHENSGLIGALTSAGLDALAARGFPLVLNLHASPVTMLGALAGGWRATAPLEALRLAPTGTDGNRAREWLQRQPLLWRLARQPWLDTAEERRPFGALERRAAAGLHAAGAALSLEAEPPVADIAELVTRLGHDGRLRQVRDPAWLEWKYANPLAAHRFLCWRERRLEGYVALEKSLSRNADRLEVAIVDCEGATPGIVELLLGTTIALLADQPLTAWRRALPAVAAQLLDRLGFEARPAGNALARQCPCVLVKRLGGAEPRVGGLDALDLGNWDLRQAYAD